MKEINDGGPAFPVIAEHGLGHISNGMTLRDWFAGQALVGYLAQPGPNADDSEIAKMAYVRADAMIAERNK